MGIENWEKGVQLREVGIENWRGACSFTKWASGVAKEEGDEGEEDVKVTGSKMRSRPWA